MSGNIHDTNVSLIQSQVQSLLKDIDNLQDNDKAIDFEYEFKKKYKHLSNTSSTLFKYILTNYNTPNFNMSFFQKTLDLMLHNVSKIQDNKTSQHNASTQVGQILAKEYIPHLS
jgi:hypothetical protein